ncbi:MAG: hypothetical protein GX257_10920, partial [Clostridiales bacterium]|nr:hypothetical protein [Clostridiales bacterium]
GGWPPPEDAGAGERGGLKPPVNFRGIQNTPGSPRNAPSLWVGSRMDPEVRDGPLRPVTEAF